MRRWNRFHSIFLRRSFRRFASGGARKSLSYDQTVAPKPLITYFKSRHENVEPGGVPHKHADPAASRQNGGDTIYALSTAPGRAAIAVIRISGPAALNVYHALCPSKPAVPKPRYATLRTLYNPSPSDDDDKILDSGALVFYFPGPETATGEDVLELHTHGGTAVVKAVLAVIPKCLPNSDDIINAPIRYAEPGEFTRRAFYNDRLDLVQIETLASTLSAETEQQRRLALRNDGSSLTERYEAWRHKLLYARGELEALIDFSEDQHFDESPAELCKSVARQVKELVGQLQSNIEGAAKGELLQNGITVALIGAPNAGKSSLLNCIVGREAAIVSEHAGTTRDVVEVSVDIGGYLCRFGDVAGLRKIEEEPSQSMEKSSEPEEKGSMDRSSVNEIEQEGMRRSKLRALTADVVIVICSIYRNGSDGEKRQVAEVDSEVAELLEQINPQTQKVVCVMNKVDTLGRGGNKREEPAHALARHPSLRPFLKPSKMPLAYPISCLDAVNVPPTDDNPDPGGIQKFLNGLTQLFRGMTSTTNDDPADDDDNKNNNNKKKTSNHQDHVATATAAAWAAESLGTTERQRVLLQQCLNHLFAFLHTVRSQPTVDQDQGRDLNRNRNLIRKSGATKIEAAAEMEVGEGQEIDIDIVLAAENLRAAADCLARITGKGEAGDVEEVLGVVFEK